MVHSSMCVLVADGLFGSIRQQTSKKSIQMSKSPAGTSLKTEPPQCQYTHHMQYYQEKHFSITKKPTAPNRQTANCSQLDLQTSDSVSQNY